MNYRKKWKRKITLTCLWPDVKAIPQNKGYSLGDIITYHHENRQGGPQKGENFMKQQESSGVRNEDFEILNFLLEHPKLEPDAYAGKYHHLKFDWRPLLSDRGLIEDSRKFIDALDALGVFDFEEMRVFVAQVLYATMKGRDALECLLFLAFGKGD